MAMIDSTVVNVALPVLQSALDATTAQVQWVVEAYALFLAALILVGGSLGDRWGRRRIFAAGIGLFALASLWCGLAPDVNQLIIGRAVQGVGGALLVPGSLAIISAAFDESQRGRAIGTWSGFTAITSAVGPILGGWLIENTSWRWIFFLNLPLALIVLVLVFTHVPESRGEERGRLDWPGAVFVTLGLGAIVFGLIEAGRLGLGHFTALSTIVLGAIALLTFVWVEAHSRAPMMPLSLFRSATFSGANLLTLLLYAGLSGALFFLPFNLIQVQGYSATAAGAALLPFILLMFVLSRWSGGLVNRYGAKRPLIVGPIVTAIGFAMLALPGVGGSYWQTFFPAVVVLGLGMSISVAPLTTTVMAAVPVRQAGIASGINNAVARTAGLLAIAVLGLVVAQVFNRRLDTRLAALAVPTDVLRLLADQRVKLAGAEIPNGVAGSLQSAIEQAIDQSYIDSFRLTMLIAAGLALASAIAAAAMIQNQPQGDLLRESRGRA